MQLALDLLTEVEEMRVPQGTVVVASNVDIEHLPTNDNVDTCTESCHAEAKANEVPYKYGHGRQWRLMCWGSGPT